MPVLHRLDPAHPPILRQVPVIDLTDLAAARGAILAMYAQVGTAPADPTIQASDHSAPGVSGSPDVKLRMFRPNGATGKRSSASRICVSLRTRSWANCMRGSNMRRYACRPRVCRIACGHPLADFAYHAMMYRMPPNIVAGLADADLAALNIPSEEAYVASYCQRTGRASMPGYGFYVAFNLFRLAAILHGIKGRVVRGNAASAKAMEHAAAFPRLAELAWLQVGLIDPVNAA